MRGISPYILIIPFFFLGFLALNYVVFYGISSLFSLPRTNIYTFLLLIAAISFPATTLLERKFSNHLTRALYAAAATWIGVSFYILFLLIIYSIINLFIETPPETAGIVMLALALGVSIYAVINATRLKVNEIKIPLNYLKKDIRAVQLTDIHIGPVRNLGFLKDMVGKTNQLDPEIVFITGDLFDGTSMIHNSILDVLNTINAPVLFVTGNHDVYQGLDEIFSYLTNTKIKTLKNEVFHFKDLQIVGVDYSLENGYLENKLQEIELDRTKPIILMYHLPREFEAAKQAGVNLQLSGHTHDGQFFPFNYLVKLIFTCITGLYEYHGAYIYVSQGTGTWGPPMRLGSRCEITLVNLKVKNP